MTLSGMRGLTPPAMTKLTRYTLGEDTLPGGIKADISGVAGSSNFLYIPAEFRISMPLVIHVQNKASDNVVVVGENTRVAGHIFFHANRCNVAFGDEISQPSPVSVRFWNNDQRVVWGKGATSNGTTIFVHGNARSVLIGDYCMFADGITIRTADQHGIFDLATEELLNPSADVVVEPCAWLCQDVILLKGAHVGFGSIVGARSVVTGPVPRNALVAGQPAKVIRTAVGWTRHELPEPGIADRLQRERDQLPPFEDLYSQWTQRPG